MSDYTRQEAIKWCRDNMADFHTPVFPPPSGRLVTSRKIAMGGGLLARQVSERLNRFVRRGGLNAA